MSNGAHRFSVLGGIVLSLATVGCNDHPLEKVRLESESNKGVLEPISINRNVDILFVIDNSGSMADEQATLARNFGSLVAELDDLQADYRIGVTTTDNGNLWMPGCGGDKAHGGALRVRSCLARAEEFQFDDDDAFERACESICQHEEIEFLPTKIAGDSEERPRPWIESIGGTTNLANGVTPAEAFECIGPQGIRGCGFESHLESMYKTLLKSEQPDEEAFGFLRQDALLAVIFVTDEADCSAKQDQAFAEAWDVAGTSAQCWAFGVRCEQTADGVYTNCVSADVTVAGEEGAPGEAILHPISRYIQKLDELEEERRGYDSDAQRKVVVSVIGGVPTSYGEGQEISYADAVGDPAYQEQHGIGPGCATSFGKAAPPVRLRDVASEFSLAERPDMHSVCRDDYSESLTQIADIVGKLLPPPCIEECIADQDPSTPELEADCIFTEVSKDGSGQTIETEVPPCDFDAAGEPVVPDDASVCYELLVGDQMQECQPEDSKVEVNLVRREGGPPPSAVLEAQCALDFGADCGG